MLIDDILLSITAVVMLYALYRYAKIYMALIKEDKAKKKEKANNNLILLKNLEKTTKRIAKFSVMIYYIW